MQIGLYQTKKHFYGGEYYWQKKNVKYWMGEDINKVYSRSGIII